jgi:type II secretory pathway pseudopilin PulG
MDKYAYNKSLRTSRARISKPAFTLAELIVATGILALMLALAGQVFSVTSRSSGQATALTNVTQSLRAFEKTFREDLRHVNTSTSLMVIQSNPMSAYWTRNGLDADDRGPGGLPNPNDGYPHADDPEREIAMPGGGDRTILTPPRADIIMFFSTRKASSRLWSGTIGQAQQVVYGHAIPTELRALPGNQLAPEFDGNAFPTDGSLVRTPAQDWHLARRAVILSEASSPIVEDPRGAGQISAWSDAPTTADILLGNQDVLGDFDYERQVFELHPWPEGRYPPFLPRVLPLENPVPVRSLLDVDPPAGASALLGHYFLPNCASFKVEWALDPNSEYVRGRLDGEPEVYWIDMGRFPTSASYRDGAFKAIFDAADAAAASGDMARATRLRELLTEEKGVEGGNTYSLLTRFQDVENWNSFGGSQPNTAIFKPRTRRENTQGAPLVDDPIFPGALRITVDVYDDVRRLERPIRHVMIIPIGS